PGGGPDLPPLMHQRGGTCDVHRRVTRTSAFLARGVRRATSGRPPTAWCQAGPACLPQVTTPVTPGGDLPRSTVLDEHGGARVPAASGGDVACPHDVAMAQVAAVGAAKATASGLGDPPGALGAGGRAAPLIHAHHLDARGAGLVGEGAHEVGAPPLAQAQVVGGSRVLLTDARRVPHGQGAHAVVHGPGDNGFGRLVLALADAPAVAGLGPALGRAELAPSAAAPLAPAGGLGRHLAGPGLAVGEMQAPPGPEGP